MKSEIIAKLIAHVVSECAAIDTDRRYDEMLDECFSFESVGGIFASMQPSRVLQECDPIAYRCGKNDWVDGEGYFEIESDNYDPDEVEKAREEFVENLESELSDLEKELEEAEKEADAADENDFSPGLEVTRIKSAITDKSAEIKEANDYTF